jgi:hypothetical protein
LKEYAATSTLGAGSNSTPVGGVAVPVETPFLSKLWLLHPAVAGLHHPGWASALISCRLVPAIPSEFTFSASASGGAWQPVVSRCCRKDP